MGSSFHVGGMRGYAHVQLTPSLQLHMALLHLDFAAVIKAAKWLLMVRDKLCHVIM